MSDVTAAGYRNQRRHFLTDVIRGIDTDVCGHVDTETWALVTHAPIYFPLSGTTRVSRYQKGKNSLDFTEARDSEWQWHQLGHCKSAPRSRQITTPTPHHSVFLQAGCPSCRPTNSVSTEGKFCQVSVYKICATEGQWVEHLVSPLMRVAGLVSSRSALMPLHGC